MYLFSKIHVICHCYSRLQRKLCEVVAMVRELVARLRDWFILKALVTNHLRERVRVAPQVTHSVHMSLLLNKQSMVSN